MEVHGRIAGSSNATLLVTCRLGADEMLAVYKPSKGERPLWDFPGGLFRREIAAYVLSETLGWGLVPETIARDEGPFGPGSVQRFVHEDGESHYFTLRDEPRWHQDLMRVFGQVLIQVFENLVHQPRRESPRRDPGLDLVREPDEEAH